MLYVFCNGVKVDKDIVNVHDEELVDHVLENLIHEGLEDCGSIGETAEPNEVFVVIPSGDECRLPDEYGPGCKHYEGPVWKRW